LGEDVLFSDPDTGANFLSFNQEDGTEFYKADRSNKTVGEVLLYLYQQHTAAMREKKAGPASGLVYSGSFAALDAVVPNLTVSGTLLQAEETLLALMPEYAINVDPDTRQRSVIKRSTATTRQVKTSECHALPSLSRDLTRNRTAIIIYGTTPDAEETGFLWDPADEPGSTLTPLWDRTLEGAYTADKAKRTLNHGTIVGFGLQVGGANAGLHLRRPRHRGRLRWTNTSGRARLGFVRCGGARHVQDPRQQHEPRVARGDGVHHGPVG
jgi:hypothetical protein